MKSEKGITLVEGLLTLGITTIVGILLVIIIVNTGGLFYQQSSKVSIGLSVNDALAKISETVRSASQVATSYTSGTETYISGTQKLVLKIPSLDSSGNILLNTSDYFVFFLDPSTGSTGSPQAGSGQELRLKVFPDALSARASQDQIFSNNANLLEFNYLDSQNPPQEIQPDLAKKVRVTLSLKQKAGAGYEQNIATSEANLRND